MKLKLVPLIAVTIIALGVNTLTSAQETGSFTDDRDGKEYKTVIIGEQCWMGENLAFEVSSGSMTYTGIKDYAKTHGYFYNWETATKVCPEGWHLPSNAEWQDLSNYLGGDAVAGGKMKEPGTATWSSPNAGATNSSGFNSLCSGRSDDNEYKAYIGLMTFFWTSEDEGEEDGICRALYSAKPAFTLYGVKKNEGYSVRCIKD